MRPCLQIIVSIIMNVRAAMLYSNLYQAIAVYSVLTVAYLAHLYSRHGWMPLLVKLQMEAVASEYGKSY